MSKIELTDQELTKIARSLTSNPDCRIVLMENMSWADSRTCSGRLAVESGKVKILDSCGEPCSFVCKTSREFYDHLSMIKVVVKAINLVRA